MRVWAWFNVVVVKNLVKWNEEKLIWLIGGAYVCVMKMGSEASSIIIQKNLCEIIYIEQSQ